MEQNHEYECVGFQNKNHGVKESTEQKSEYTFSECIAYGTVTDGTQVSQATESKGGNSAPPEELSTSQEGIYD